MGLWLSSRWALVDRRDWKITRYSPRDYSSDRESYGYTKQEQQEKPTNESHT